MKRIAFMLAICCLLSTSASAQTKKPSSFIDTPTTYSLLDSSHIFPKERKINVWDHGDFAIFASYRSLTGALRTKIKKDSFETDMALLRVLEKYTKNNLDLTIDSVKSKNIEDGRLRATSLGLIADMISCRQLWVYNKKTKRLEKQIQVRKYKEKNGICVVSGKFIYIGEQKLFRVEEDQYETDM